MALTDGLISHWRLDEASGVALDAYGTNTLTDNNTVGVGTGKVNGCRDFESDNSEFFSIADNASLSTGDIDFELSCWVNAESLSGNPMIVSKMDAANTGASEYQLFWSSTFSRFRWAVYGGAGLNTAANSSVIPSTGTWYFVSAYHDSVNNLVGIAVNAGTPVTTACTHGSRDSAQSFRIGARGTGAGDELHWDGLIDELSFWKRVLSAGERTQLYNSGNGLDFVPRLATDRSYPRGVYRGVLGGVI